MRVGISSQSKEEEYKMSFDLHAAHFSLLNEAQI